MATALSVLGALAILGPAFNGVSFLNYGHPFSSMIMAGLWALALACYLTGMFLPPARPAGRSVTPPASAPHLYPGPGPAGIVIPPQIPADAARVVLACDAPSPLRSAVALRLRASTALMACVVSPRHLPHILSAGTSRSGGGLAAAAVVFAAVPRPPGLACCWRVGYRASSLPADSAHRLPRPWNG